VTAELWTRLSDCRSGVLLITTVSAAAAALRLTVCSFNGEYDNVSTTEPSLAVVIRGPESAACVASTISVSEAAGICSVCPIIIDLDDDVTDDDDDDVVADSTGSSLVTVCGWALAKSVRVPLTVTVSTVSSELADLNSTESTLYTTTTTTHVTETLSPTFSHVFLQTYRQY